MSNSKCWFCNQIISLKKIENKRKLEHKRVHEKLEQGRQQRKTRRETHITHIYTDIFI